MLPAGGAHPLASVDWAAPAGPAARAARHLLGLTVFGDNGGAGVLGDSTDPDGSGGAGGAGAPVAPVAIQPSDYVGRAGPAPQRNWAPNQCSVGSAITESTASAQNTTAR